MSDNTLLNNALNRIGNSTIQLWEKEMESTEWYPIATGILCSDGAKCYILTCAHTFAVVDGVNKVQGIVMNNSFTPLNEERVLAPDTIVHGKCDVAIIKLSSDTTDYIREIGYEFLDKKHLGINLSVQNESMLHICGYPANKTKGPIYGRDGKKIQIEIISDLNHERIIFPIVFSSKLVYLALPYIDVISQYERRGIEKETHLLLSFHYKKLSRLNGSRITLPKPSGMSGSGLWAITSDGNYHLLGIMIEYNLKDSLMLATRIDYVTELMRHVYNSDLPKSNIIPTKWYLDNSIPNKL